MAQLISKGGFRERANRSRKYQGSENRKTILHSSKYQPNTAQSTESVHIEDLTPCQTLNLQDKNQ